MRSRSPSCRFWLLAVAAQLLLLLHHCVANETPEMQDADRPQVNWNNLFKAFIMMGDGPMDAQEHRRGIAANARELYLKRRQRSQNKGTERATTAGITQQHNDNNILWYSMSTSVQGFYQYYSINSIIKRQFALSLIKQWEQFDYARFSSHCH